MKKRENGERKRSKLNQTSFVLRPVNTVLSDESGQPRSLNQWDQWTMTSLPPTPYFCVIYQLIDSPSTGHLSPLVCSKVTYLLLSDVHCVFLKWHFLSNSKGGRICVIYNQACLRVCVFSLTWGTSWLFSDVLRLPACEFACCVFVLYSLMFFSTF